MDSRERGINATAELGFLAGPKNTSREQAVAQLATRGLRVPTRTIPDIRCGGTKRLADQLRNIYAADQGSALLKDGCYFNMALAGIPLAEEVKQVRYAHRKNSKGFTNSLARKLGFKTQALRRRLRAMRTDFVYASLNGSDEELQAHFCAAANQYLTDFTTPDNNLVSKSVKKLQSAWDKKTIPSFYLALYTQMGTRAIGTWTAYEIDILARFYARQCRDGAALTPFDLMVLNTPRDETSMEQFVNQVKSETGIKIDENVVWVHRNTLVYGTPTRPATP